MLWRWLLAWLTWLAADQAVIDAERPKAAAAVAAARASMADTAPAPPAPSPPKPAECCGECRGGWIVHGDGHRTQCPCPASCQCKKAGGK